MKTGKDLFEEYLKIYTDGHFGVGNDGKLHWDNDFEKVWMEHGLDVFELRDDGIYEYFSCPEGSEWLLRAGYTDLEEMDDFIAGSVMERSWEICEGLGIEWMSYSQFIEEK